MIASELEIERHPVLTDGLFAGIVGYLSIVIVMLAIDAIQGTPLHTLSALGALLFFGGPEAARAVTVDVPMALAANGIVALVLLAVGMASSYLASLVEHAPSYWYLAFVAIAFLLAAMLYLDGAFGVPGLPRFELSALALVGAVVQVTFLLWRHPYIRRHIEDVWKD